MLKRSCKQTEEKIGREMKNYRISLIIQNKFGKKKKQKKVYFGKKQQQ